MVPGTGPQPSLAMIVGEAPGRKEVKTGRPFVGKSGQLLDVALAALGVSRSYVYITNVMKELPVDEDGKIRRPTGSEILEWWPILESEIENTAPAAILALGGTASSALTGLVGDIPFGSKIDNIYTAWHPSYVLRMRNQVLVRDWYGDWLSQIAPWRDAVVEAQYA